MKFLKRYKEPLIILLVILFGFLLRYQNYTSLPRHGATFDEFAWTWLGINLIQKGVPISWSPHPQYEQREHLIYQGAAFWIVKPYLEHPPVFGLVAGGFALINGAKDMYAVTLGTIRPLALILGTLSILAIFILTRSQYGFNTAIIASMLYATIPTIVIGSRIVQNENFLIPMWLFSLIFIDKYFKSAKKKWLIAASLLAGLLSIAKVPWLVVSGSLIMLLLFYGKLKDSLFVFLITSFFISLFLLYGIYFDKDLFFNLWKLQLSRYDISFVGLYSIFTKPLLVDRFFLDGWIYFGFFSIFLLAQNFKKHLFILFPFIAYFMIYIFAIPDEPGHGWYRYPFLPFLIMSLSVFLKEYYGKNYILTFFFLTFIGTTLLQLTWFETFGFSYSIYRAMIIAWSLLLLGIFFKSKRLERMAKIWSYILFALLIILNFWAVNLFIG